MTTLFDFIWERTDSRIAPLHSMARDVSIAEVPGDSMIIRLFLGEPASESTFHVYALTQREGATAVVWIGSRPITIDEFAVVDDPHRYGFMFVTCVRKGVDLVCTPWSYNHPWEGIGTRRAESVTLANVVTVRRDDKNCEWVGLRHDVDLLARVCAMANHGTDGYMLRTSESGNAWTLEISSTHRMWCTA